MKKLLALCLAAALLLAGCSGAVIGEADSYAQQYYTRPDLAELNSVLETSCEIARTGTDVEEVIDAVWDFYDVYDEFYTGYNLAYIGYCADLTDIYWQQEYAYCEGKYASVDAALEELYYALAQSPIREELESEEYFGAGYFDYYEGESIWDDTFLGFFDRETELLERYYDLYQQSLEEEYYSDAYFDTYAEDLCQVLVDLVLLRQEQAAYVGYDSYVDFAYDFYFYRDYTPAQAEAYLEEIRDELVELYREVSDSDVWDYGNEPCTLKQSYAYLEDCAKAMGGDVKEAFTFLDRRQLYDIGSGENRYDTSFEVYLTSFYEPFIFMTAYQDNWDKLTLVHEFGHFAADHACWGSYAGTDVQEVFSQGMEYLSLCYSEDAQLEALKLADGLCTMVEQAAYASFEQQLYELDPAELTTERVFALYAQVLADFGGSQDWDPRDLVLVNHFYTNPMYVISYVVSSDTALQLYQIEKDDPGAGLAIYEENLSSEESYFLAFLEAAGLESPFETGRIQQVRQTLEEMLG